MSARQRLAEVAKARGSSLAALSRMLGRNSTYLQQFITKGSPKKLEEGDRSKLANFLDIPECELGAPSKPSSDSIDEWVEVDRLDVDVAAGYGSIPTHEKPFDSFRFSRNWLSERGLTGARLSAIRVIGDSMEPLLREGDEVLVDLREQPFRDGIHVVRLDETLLVKRVASQGKGRFSLLSQNLAYPPIAVNAEEVSIIGRVVWKSGRV